MADEPAEPLAAEPSPGPDVGGLVERYDRMLREEEIAELKRRLEEMTQRIWYGAPERGEPSLLADELAVARAMGRKDRNEAGSRSPDLLLVTLGYSPEPILLAVAYHAPADVVLLAAESLRVSRDYLTRFRALWNSLTRVFDQRALGEQDGRIRGVRDDSASYFQAVRQLVEERRPAAPRILLDITGAKKSMIAGAFLAAGYLDLEVSYVDFEGYDPLLHRPDPLSSRPRALAHPVRLFRLREEGDLAAAFDRRRFEEAAGLAGSLAEMAESPEVVEILGREPAARQRVRYERVGRSAKALSLWGAGFYRDADSALEREKLAVPPTARLLSRVWPSREARHQEIVEALEEDRVFASPSTALAYLVDVLVWVDEDHLASRPRDGYLRLYGAIESALSYLFEALAGRRPAGFVVKVLEPEKLATLESSAARNAATDWAAVLRAGALLALRKSSTTAFAVLAGKERSILPEVDRALLREELARQARELVPWVTCRIDPPPLDKRVYRSLTEKKSSGDVFYLGRYSDLRHKAVHWMAPVPHEMARDLRSFYAKLLRTVIPLATDAYLPALAGPERAELAGWRELLLAAAEGKIPPSCRPPRLVELEAWSRETIPQVSDTRGEVMV